MDLKNLFKNTDKTRQINEKKWNKEMTVNSSKSKGSKESKGVLNKIKKDKPALEKIGSKKHSFKEFLKLISSIRTKLILAFLVPVVLIIVLGVLSYSTSSKGLVQSYESSTLSTMNYMAKYLNFGLATVSEKADALNTNEVMIKYYSGMYAKDVVEEASRLKEVESTVTTDIVSLDYISNVYIFSNYGKGFTATGTDASLLNYDDFAAKGEGALMLNTEADKVWMGKHPYLDSLTGMPESSYALSCIENLNNIFGTPIGCVVIDVSYDYINKTISDSGLPKGSIIAFITGDGREVVSGTIPTDYKFVDQTYYKDVLSKTDTTEGSKYIQFNGAKYLFTYSILDTSGSMLCSLTPNSVIVAKANEVKNITFFMVFMASIIAIALGTIIASGFSNTIHKVNAVLHKTETGDLTYYTSVKRKDEFRILGKSINDVIGSMQNLIRKMTGTGTTVSNSALSVSESSAILISATKEIADAVNDIEHGVTQQAIDAESCLHLMSDLADKINNLNDSTHNIEQIAGNTQHIVSGGLDIIDNLSVKVKDTTEVTRTVITDIENLEMKSKSISGIIETISGIAEQTNLLSLNASIEAARAGEFGRGFSVVAQEIRKLAEQSAKASGEIAQIIRDIENQTQKTVKTAKSAEEIVLSQSDALKSTVNVFTDINQHVDKLTNNLDQISGGVEAIERAKNETLKAIESISATSQETAAATEELGVIAENQLLEVNKLNDVINQLNDDAGSMMDVVKVFKIN